MNRGGPVNRGGRRMKSGAYQSGPVVLLASRLAKYGFMQRL